LIVAHPDDECMFFTPALIELQKRYEIHAITLSNGGYDGLGAIRTTEFKKALSLFGISQENIVCRRYFRI